MKGLGVNIPVLFFLLQPHKITQNYAILIHLTIYHSSHNLCLSIHLTSCSLREIGWHAMHWIDLIEDRDQWRALVNMVLNLWVP
jgi:hypothetical protein